MFIGAFLFLMSRIFGGPEGIPAGTPPVVIITVLDPGIYTAAYIEDIKENRMEYARKHGELNSYNWACNAVLTKKNNQ